MDAARAVCACIVCGQKCHLWAPQPCCATLCQIASWPSASLVLASASAMASNVSLLTHAVGPCLCLCLQASTQPSTPHQGALQGWALPFPLTWSSRVLSRSCSLARCSGLCWASALRQTKAVSRQAHPATRQTCVVQPCSASGSSAAAAQLSLRGSLQCHYSVGQVSEKCCCHVAGRARHSGVGCQARRPCRQGGHQGHKQVGAAPSLSAFHQGLDEGCPTCACSALFPISSWLHLLQG